MKFNKSSIVLIIPAVIAIIAVSVLVANSVNKEENIITGIVESTQVDVASKIPGRVDTVFVSEGDMVHKGQILARLESKEMDAKLGQARGLVDAAKSKVQMAHNGARPEEKQAAERLYFQAKAQYELANKTWTRIQSLFRDGVISAQEKDQSEFQFKAAKEQMEAAKARLDMVNKGARLEEISGAEALYFQAQNTYNEAQAYHEELNLVSPITGELSKKITNPGEIIASGYPLFTVMDPSDTWVVLQVREDKMSSIKKGSVFYGKVPALGNRKLQFEVSYISPMAEFATWKPTNQKGEFDLKTFEIRLRSKSQVKDLRPGMTVNIIM
ncbi:MAG: HlyD family secretion protein [Bacteroidota bacterium]|nr:HlyD family efflux transporter periplasmic adaptor subunit [Ignavibacteria bacterium]HEX2961805.1 efflux RND transporter periplasmic adaptor subunit [Ignavibacteriales bacterium]MCU7498411.1 HlyD family efflux transporter periplasmic adaptor subunit [Ignavibacteria bacterium]MCU7511953.1 HlyD family efflux transporter periplasmic adaptor subunit [Ignavibacteria bacterium]MCU7520014.1 HlyD family efflux transporter periplasmic adaptor subunit [Ignavibacteria bacterium]